MSKKAQSTLVLEAGKQKKHLDQPIIVMQQWVGFVVGQ